MADDPLLNDLKAKLGIGETNPAPGADSDGDPLGPHLEARARLRSMLAAELRR
jgi:hypothetical protein